MILAFGIVLGYCLGAKEEKFEQRKKRLQNLKVRFRNRKEQSGTIRPKVTTHAEAEAQERKPFTERFKELGGSEPPDDIVGFLEP